MCAAQAQKPDLMTSPVTFIKAVTRQELGEKTWFPGGAFCSDGRLLMADYWNRRLLQLDVDYNVVEQFKVDGMPSDVAIGNNDNEIYVAVNYQYIYKCTLDTDLTVVSRIKPPGGNWDISVSGEDIVVGTGKNVVILQHDGGVMQSIPRSGETVCYVARSQQTIWHTDNHDIVCRTLKGNEIFRYQHQKLRGPLGVCVDRHNNLYTCGFYSHNVHQVSLDRRSGRILVDNLHSISGPQNIMFHPQRDELIVTSNKEDTVFEVYRFG